MFLFLLLGALDFWQHLGPTSLEQTRGCQSPSRSPAIQQLLLEGGLGPCWGAEPCLQHINDKVQITCCRQHFLFSGWLLTSFRRPMFLGYTRVGSWALPFTGTPLCQVNLQEGEIQYQCSESLARGRVLNYLAQ